MRPPRYWPVKFRRSLVLTVVLAFLACRPSAVPEVPAPLEVTTKLGTELAFDPARVVAPSQVRVRLVFSNVSTLAHNLVLLSPLDGGTRPIVQPGESDVFEFDTPPPGTYRFVCSIHEDMSGTLESR